MVYDYEFFLTFAGNYNTDFNYGKKVSIQSYIIVT